MRDEVMGLSALEQLRVQRARLAERLRPPWWYLPGSAFLWAMVGAVPFAYHYLNAGAYLSVLVLAVWVLLQWGLARATGVAVGTRTLRYPSARTAGIAMLVAGFGAMAAESVLLNNGLVVAAIAVAVPAVPVAVACQWATLRGIRRDLRRGGEGL